MGKSIPASTLHNLVVEALILIVEDYLETGTMFTGSLIIKSNNYEDRVVDRLNWEPYLDEAIEIVGVRKLLPKHRKLLEQLKLS